MALQAALPARHAPPEFADHSCASRREGGAWRTGTLRPGPTLRRIVEAASPAP